MHVKQINIIKGGINSLQLLLLLVYNFLFMYFARINCVVFFIVKK